jgi:hypothetical protein
LVAGQAAACLTCYAHHYPIRKRKGARVDYMLTEGTDDIDATAILKNAPHPNTAWLFARWGGQRRRTEGLCPRRQVADPPKSRAGGKNATARVYPVGENDIKDFPKYEKL